MSKEIGEDLFYERNIAIRLEFLCCFKCFQIDCFSKPFVFSSPIKTLLSSNISEPSISPQQIAFVLYTILNMISA